MSKLNTSPSPSLFIIFIFYAILFSCKEVVVPKPKGYYQMDFPQTENFKTLQISECPFSFSYPDYVVIEKDTLFFNEKPEDPCWLNVHYNGLNGIVHMSYKPLQKNDLYQLTEDYHKMTNKHVVKADFIDESVISEPKKNIYGLISEVGGDVASSYQFYITDSAQHFVRGALYFRAEPNADSLKPAVLFVRDDVIDMLKSWNWSN